MQGTAPFIAIELLIHGSPHRTAHDLESILYVLLFICTHLKGPGCQVRDPPLYGGDNKSIHPSSMKQWFAASHLATLGHLKFSHMMSHFDTFILSAISPYFFPLKDYIGNFWKALIPERESITSDGERVVHSKATPQDIINVLKAALLDTELISEHKSTSVLGKRSVPGDLVSDSSWDPVKAPKNLRLANPKVSPRHTRNTKFMAKR